jgi:hypothetical protein
MYTLKAVPVLLLLLAPTAAQSACILGSHCIIKVLFSWQLGRTNFAGCSVCTLLTTAGISFMRPQQQRTAAARLC